jgi:hypothetical protein
MTKRVPKHNPTPDMVDYMLSELLKPIPFWKRLGKESRKRKVYAQQISEAYENEFRYGRKLLQFCKEVQKINEDFSGDLKAKINELMLQALAEDQEIEKIIH